MLSPEYLEIVPEDIVRLYAQLDEFIAKDIARRLVKDGVVTSTTEYQMLRLQEAGSLYQDIIYQTAKLKGISDKEIQGIFDKAVAESVASDNAIYQEAGFEALKLSESDMNLITAQIKKTLGDLNNLVMTTALTSQQAFISAASFAELKVETGAMDYIQAIRQAIRDSAGDGAFVTYPSGRRNRLDVAVRRSVLTGVGQTTGQVSMGFIGRTGCDLVETTAHPGARPDHQVWQGKIFSMTGTKYPDFYKSTGYGTGEGLCGWNCRHAFFPFFAGISERAYNRDKLQEYNDRKVPFEGKLISYYEASQVQRSMERQIRALKRQTGAYDEGSQYATGELGDELKKDATEAKLMLYAQQDELAAFVRKAGLTRQKEREYVII